MSKEFKTLLAIILMAAVSFVHWLIFYKFPNFERWTIWYIGFAMFIPAVLLLNSAFKSQIVIIRCLIVFTVLILGQSISDFILIKYYFNGSISEIYNFWTCMSVSWGGNIFLSCIPFLKKSVHIKKNTNEDLVDDLDW